MKFDSRYQEDNYYMKKALELAKLGIGAVNPNPLVGCIIVKDGKVIGEGYHMKFGGPHAEVNAINSSKEDIEGATVYVTLEPCSHFGKTPPCADNLVRHKVKRVVICNNDPNPLVAGNGIKKLQNAGIEVTTGILEKEGFVHRSRNPKNQREILIHLTDTAYNRLVKHPPRHHVAVKEQMSRILTAQEQEQFSYLLDKLVSGIEQITVE